MSEIWEPARMMVPKAGTRVQKRNDGTKNRTQQRRKKRTLPPPKENLLENFSDPKKKTFQTSGGYKNPIKTR